MSAVARQESNPAVQCRTSEAPTCFDHPAACFGIVDAGQMGFDLVRSDRDAQFISKAADRLHGACRILQRLTKQGLGLFGIAFDPLVKLGSVV